MKTIKYLCLAALVLTACNNKTKTNEVPTQNDAPQVTVATEGEEAPDFTLTDHEGKPFQLSSLRGQYVVLDFWGTWCKWCVKGIPDMKTYYEKYQDKLEIVSIDFGDDKDTWLKAIDTYEMNWKHVCTDEESASKLQEDYAIEGFPTKVVIDPEGKIVHTTVGEDPEFYAFLDDMFGKN